MTNSKHTKRALLSSVLALLLCFTMLLGTTFAWFTDNASTSVSKIEAGTLDVVLEMWDSDKNDWVSAEGKTLDFVAADGNTEILWEPNCTYNLPELRIRNNGNLALKYKIALTVEDGTTGKNGEKLNDVLEWFVDGAVIDHDYTLEAKATQNFTISAHMEQTAGNEYMGTTIKGVAITVYATQATVEKDSISDQYDKDAKYDLDNDGKSDVSDEDSNKIMTLEALKEAIANEETTIELGANINLDGYLNIGYTVTLNGNGFGLYNAPVKVGADSVINNVVFNTPVNSQNNGSNLYCYDGGLTVNNCTFKNTQWDAIQVTPKDGDAVTISGCTFTANSNGAERFIHIEAPKNSNAKVNITITNNRFGTWDEDNDDIIGLYYVNLNYIDFGGDNTFADSKEAVAGKIWICGESSAKTITGEVAYDKFVS